MGSSLHVEPSGGLDVVVHMLKCVFCSHIPLEIEFKPRISMGAPACSRWFLVVDLFGAGYANDATIEGVIYVTL